MQRPTLSLALPALAIVALAVAGCGPKETRSPADAAMGEPVYFPPPPAPPRLQYLLTLEGAEDVTAPRKGSFADWVVGATPQQTGAARFNSPYGIDADRGKLYVCDVAADRVHVLDLVGETYALLGDPDEVRNPVNIKIDDRTGRRYVCDTGSRRIHVFDRNDKPIDVITNPEPWTPIDVAVHGDRLYVCDVTEGVVWVVATDGNVLSRISRKGNGPDELSMPTNLEVGPDGRLYVVDSLQQVVKVFDTEGNFLDTIGRPGADIGGFARPKGIAIDHDGVIYVADAQWDVVQLFNRQGDLLMVFGSPGEEPYAMGLPAGLAIDRSSISAFQRHIAPDFRPEYLLFVVNQFGKNKVVVYAFGRDLSFDPDQYRPDRAEEVPPSNGPPGSP